MEHTLEDELRRLALTKSDAMDYLTKYEAMKSYLDRQYYGWIQASCPFFTDHGKQHVESVMITSSMLLQHRYGAEVENGLTQLEIFLLLSAILWHDVGNVINRSGHAQLVRTMTSDIGTIGFGDQTLRGFVVNIVRAHAGKDGLSVVDIEQNYERSTIFPRALAAILRFADEVSETATRISQSMLQFNRVPNENLIYWEFASCVTASIPEPNRQRVVLNINIPIEKLMRQYQFSEHGENGLISLLDYIIIRLEKINNERAYCDREFRRYVIIREIDVRLTIMKDTDFIEGYRNRLVLLGDGGMSAIQDGYPQINISHNFFERYPEWNPTVIGEVINRVNTK